MADTVRTQQELLDRMKINVAGVQVGRRADINVQTFRDFVISIPTLGAPGLSNIVEDLTPQLGGNLDLNSFSIVASNASGPEILDLASSGSVATVRPNRGTNSGLGGSGGTVDIIVNGLATLRVGTGIGNPNTVLQPLGTSGLLLGSVSGSFGLHNLAASAAVPTLLPSFLTETAGIGANVAGSVSIITASLERLRLDSTGNANFLTPSGAFDGGAADSFRLHNVATSATVPVFIPRKGAEVSGWGSAAAHQLNAICLSNTVMEWRSNQISFAQFMFALIANGPRIQNEASSATNAVFLPDKTSLVAGIGGVAGAVTMIADSLERITANATGLGFFATTPAARPTGVAVTAAGIHAALVTLGLITA